MEIHADNEVQMCSYERRLLIYLPREKRFIRDDKSTIEDTNGRIFFANEWFDGKEDPQVSFV
jgi:hypothetical protein